MRGSAWLDVLAGLIKDDLWLQTENNTMQQCTDISRAKTTERSQVNSFSQRLSRTLVKYHVNLEEDHLKEQFNLNVSFQLASIVTITIKIGLCVWDFVTLTIVGHAHRQALLKATVLALVSVPLLDLTAAFTLVVLQFEANGPAEKTLQCGRNRNPVSFKKNTNDTYSQAFTNRHGST